MKPLKQIVKITGDSIPINTLDTIILADNYVSNFKVYTNDVDILKLQFNYNNVKVYDKNEFNIKNADYIINLNHKDKIIPQSNENKYYIIKKINNCNLFTNSNYYKLEDMVQSKTLRNKYMGQQYHYKTFPNSIASEYMKKTSLSNDFEVLGNILKNRLTTDHNIQPDTAVLHLRVGDVINNSRNQLFEFLAYPVIYKTGCQYVSSIGQIENTLHNIPTIKSIIIIAGIHMDIDQTKSCDYIAAIKHHLEKTGYKVTTRLGNNPDDDFVFMCTVPCFISSGGGFSKLVINLRKYLKIGNSFELNKK